MSPPNVHCITAVVNMGTTILRDSTAGSTILTAKGAEH